MRSFFAEQVEVCPSCSDDHCLYLASVKLLDSEGNLDTEFKQFPSNQYVYNNHLLYKLLTCGEQRLGRLPEIPALNRTGLPVVRAVTALRFAEGLSVEDGGYGKAVVSASVGGGLVVDGANRIAAELGDGLKLEGNRISANPGEGLSIRQGAIAADVGNGVEIASDKIAAKLGRGVTFESDRVAADLGQGLTFGASNIANKAPITVRLGDGLTFVENGVSANLGPGLMFDAGRIAANVGGGLKLSAAGRVEPDYAKTAVVGKVCEANDPRLSNARPPTAHAASHQARGADQIDVTELPGLLAEAQRVRVQRDGAQIAIRPTLNFTGAGVTVTDDPTAANNRLNINIPGVAPTKVSFGQVRFATVAAGETRYSPPIEHRLDSPDVAIVFCLLWEQHRTFGDPTGLPHFNVTPHILALHPQPSGPTFLFYLLDRRNADPADTAPLALDYVVCWWAIAKTQGSAEPETRSNPPDRTSPTFNETLRTHLRFFPGSTLSQLSITFKMTTDLVARRIEEMLAAGQVRNVNGRYFLN